MKAAITPTGPASVTVGDAQHGRLSTMADRIKTIWRHPIRYVRYRWARLRWLADTPYRLGDPTLGTGDLRRRNQDMLLERAERREPQPRDFGLR